MSAADHEARWEAIEREAERLVDAASDAGLSLRLVGSTGVRMHCASCRDGMARLGRQAKDIDLACPKRDRNGVRDLLEADGYLVDRDVLVAMEGTRMCFDHPDRGIDVDLFVERLSFCHTIELEGRYARHPLTVPVEDLLLAKLQVHEPTRNDVLDAAIVLTSHPVGDGHDDEATVDADYVAELLSGDWGFHHTAIANLESLGARPELAEAGVGSGERELVAARAADLRSAIDAAPKSLGWRVRDRIGERKQWWDDVNEREETY